MKAFIIHIAIALLFSVSAFLETELPLHGDVIVYFLSLAFVVFSYFRMKSEK
jgi:hypothetical protein